MPPESSGAGRRPPATREVPVSALIGSSGCLCGRRLRVFFSSRKGLVHVRGWQQPPGFSWQEPPSPDTSGHKLGPLEDRTWMSAGWKPVLRWRRPRRRALPPRPHACSGPMTKARGTDTQVLLRSAKQTQVPSWPRSSRSCPT